MKILIWVHKNDVLANKILTYHFTRPYIDRHDEYLQVEITHDEFTRLEDYKIKDKGETYPEFVKKHYPKPIPDVIKNHKTIRGGDFPKWWSSLTKEEQTTIHEYYGR